MFRNSNHQHDLIQEEIKCKVEEKKHALQLTVCDVLYSPIIVPDFTDDGDENIYNHDFDINQIDFKISSLVCELECVIKMFTSQFIWKKSDKK